MLYLLFMVIFHGAFAGSHKECFYKTAGHVLKGHQLREVKLGHHRTVEGCLAECYDMGRDQCSAVVVDRSDGYCKAFIFNRESHHDVRLVRAKSHDFYQWKSACSSEHRVKRNAQQGTYAQWQAWTACTVTCGSTGQRTRARTCQSYGVQCDGPSQEQDKCPANPPCPEWQPWGEWGTCSKTCGGGTKERTRKCNTYGGCVGDAKETQECNQQACCTTWTEWGQCSVTCGPGRKSRSRRCSVGGGLQYASKEEKDECDCTGALPVCPTWAEWGDWGQCDKTCGGGVRVKTRECSHPGKCEGEGQMSEPCNTQECPKWNPWEKWSLCTVSCAGGTKKRVRACAPAGGACDGSAEEETKCNELPCPEWSDWGPWGTCSATCGGGFMKRGRVCNQYNLCPGEAQEKKECNTHKCPEWLHWGEWGTCTASCDGGIRTRKRECDMDSDYCLGAKFGTDASCRCGDEGKTSEDESEPCNTHTCASFGPWGDWTPCSVTCGGGNRARTRDCENDASFCAGTNANDPSCLCGDVNEEPGECNAMKCPNWGAWGEWGDCSATCGGGGRERKRPCEKDETYCVGDKLETDVCKCQPGLDHSNEQCNAHTCPNWGPWNIWGPCTAKCGGGKKERTRECQTDAGFCAANAADASCTCPGENKEDTDCNGHKCAQWSEWGDWGTCGKECGGGKQKRTRTCEKDPVFCATNAQDESCICPGEGEEEQDCNTFICATWADWGEWGECSQNCGGGKQERIRTCNNDPVHCAQNSASYVCLCDGKSEEKEDKECNTQTCAEWETWGDWSKCSTSCEAGEETRERTCKTDQSFCATNAQDSACICPGDGIEKKSCNLGICPQWSQWSQWTECSVVCGGGTRTRARKCPIDDGCPGLKEDSSICNQIVCPEWGDWAQWSDCSVTCGGGSRARTRTCAIEGGCSPGGPYEEDGVACNDKVCPSWTDWTEWSTCSKSCDKGQRTKTRKCEPEPGCLGRSEDVEECLDQPCARNSYWSEWAPCTKTCDTGEQTRSRLVPGCTAATCPVETDRRECNPQACPQWTQWDEWTTCSKTCGGGSRTRGRTCPVENGCVGTTIETDPNPCNAQGC